MIRMAVVQRSFADLEFERQGNVLDEVLQRVSDFMDKNGHWVQRVYEDLVRGLKRADTGREGMTAEQVLRAFILQRVKNWDLRELRERIADGYSLRQFTRFYMEPVPSHHGFHRVFSRLQPQTLRELNEAVIREAVGLGLEDGEKLRVDTTVVETDIHYPSDSSLLYDTVRVLVRTVRKLEEQLPGVSRDFHDRRRRARRRMQEISRMDRQQRLRSQRRKYQDLIRVTEEVISSARRVAERAGAAPDGDATVTLRVAELRAGIVHFSELGERVVRQSHRRVLEGEQVPAEEKIFSIFEPHTDMIKRGKQDKPVEFGHKIFLAESGQGLITEYEVLKGNPADEKQVQRSLEHHQQLFGASPELYAGDRGFYSQGNLELCAQEKVEVACIPYRGPNRTPERAVLEKSKVFKEGQKFRAGVEGKISVLFRGRGMKRCLNEGSARFELFVGAAVLANNLLVIARLLGQKRRPRRRAIT